MGEVLGEWRAGWELLAVPALMLGDYYLTLLGAWYYSPDPTVRANYELNPHAKAAIARLQPVSPLHLAMTALMTVMVGFASTLDPMMYRFMLGVMVGGFGYLVGLHVGNVLMLRHARRAPGDVNGHATQTRGFQLLTSAHRAFAFAAAPLAILAVLQPSALLFGAVAGVAFIGYAPLQWRAQLSDAERAATATSGRALCGFCGADDKAASKLIAGRGVMICDACVETCVEALRDGEEVNCPKAPAMVA